MVHIFLRGILLGLAISFSIGPAFFSIIQTGIQRGVWYGISMAFGVALSDMTLITICLLGLSSVINDPEYKLYVGLIGGVILILYGIYSFCSKPRDPYKYEENSHLGQNKKTNFIQKHIGPNAHWPIYLIKGYFLNILNPFLIFFWLTAVGMVGATASTNEIRQSIIFFSGTILTTFSFDILKAYLGTKIQTLINYRKIVVFNKIIGIILAVFGIVLIIRLFI